MKNEYFVLFFLILGIVFFNYNFIDGLLIDKFSNYETGFVERVIDGDTIVANGTSIRLLGINSPEKGEIGYIEAKKFLEEEILEKEVKIYFGKEKFDRYNRKLGYIFLGNRNINLESVRNGFSNYYFPSGVDEFSKEIKRAWKDCLLSQKNLCQKSSNNCVKIKNVDLNSQFLILENTCLENVNLNGWSIKDEGRKKYVFLEKKLLGLEEILITSEDFKENYVWTKTGDSVFLRDSYGKLVDFKEI